VQLAASNRDAIGGFVPEIGLTDGVVTPGLKRAVRFDGEAMTPTANDIGRVGKKNKNDKLSIIVAIKKIKDKTAYTPNNDVDRRVRWRQEREKR